nr:hypothetical protein [Tanacetum cinerariifolium]
MKQKHGRMNSTKELSKRDKVLLKLDSANNQKTKSSLKKTIAFTDEGSINSDIEKFMARMDAMTMKMDAPEDEDKESTPQPKSQTPKPVKETPIPKPDKQKIPYPQRCRKEKMEAQYGRPFLHTANVVIRDKQKQLNLGVGGKILHFVKGTILEEKLFVEFDEFIAMTADENSKSESNNDEPPFKKITFNIDHKIKTSLQEPHLDFELKPLPDYLEYVFLDEPSFLPIIISSRLSEKNKSKLISV